MIDQMTISIIGAGWLGLPFGKKLVEQGYTVKGSTTRTDKLAVIEQAGIQPFLLKADPDLTGDQIDKLFNCDLLFLNLPPGRRHPNVQQYFPEQVRQILRKAKRQNVSKCIFVSSTSVYSDRNQVVTEADPIHPDRPSGKALAEAEKLVKATFGKQGTILRLAGLAGPGRSMGRFLAGRKDLPNGEAPVNLVHQTDCIDVLLAIIEQERYGKTYNVCADEHPKKKDIYPIQASRLGLEPPTFQEKGALSYKIVSNQKVKEELNYKFRYPDPMQF